ncbi:hypothetical protein [Ectobacillus ponti]|uniref:Uncharacterized protein n=1 Tax=Ectobacillus ponti TaxID=2961894 RepID=A0AA42BQ76_9BACI|nr:hypothetical protein [Ectobacillus ponti]MCP8970015.1 hypothetical protein [Ectobacillus ponti]
MESAIRKKEMIVIYVFEFLLIYSRSSSRAGALIVLVMTGDTEEQLPLSSTLEFAIVKDSVPIDRGKAIADS